MALQLNRQEEYIRIDGLEIPFFTEFDGKNVEQMPLLLEAGRQPIWVAGLMERRLALKNDNSEIASAWGDNYFDTRDAFYRHPDGRGKIVLDDINIRGINPKTKLSNGASLLDEDAEKAEEIYAELQGPRVLELTEKEIQEFDKQALTPQQVADSKVWSFLARSPTNFLQLKETGIAHREDLLPEYAEWVASKNGAKTNMALYFGEKQDKPVLRAWYVDWVGDGSYAGGRASLGDAGGRFVGLAPEAQRALFGSSQIKAYTMNEVEEAKKEMGDLNELVRPNRTSKTRALLFRMQS